MREGRMKLGLSQAKRKLCWDALETFKVKKPGLTKG